MTGTRVYNLCANVYYLRQKPEILLYSLNDNDEVGMQFAKIASQESQLVTHRHRGAGTRIPMDRLRAEERGEGDISCADPTADFTLHKADNTHGARTSRQF